MFERAPLPTHVLLLGRGEEEELVVGGGGGATDDLNHAFLHTSQWGEGHGSKESSAAVVVVVVRTVCTWRVSVG